MPKMALCPTGGQRGYRRANMPFVKKGCHNPSLDITNSIAMASKATIDGLLIFDD